MSVLAPLCGSHPDADSETTQSWTEDQKAFTEEQLVSLNDLLIGSSYCPRFVVSPSASQADP